MRNETIMAIIVIALIAVVALQTMWIFAVNTPAQTSYAPTGMATGEQFSSVEEMMQAHHGSSSGGMVGGC